MGRLYGYKKWYEIKNVGKISKKIRVKRDYDEKSKSYIVRHNENEDMKLIENDEFIKELKEYKKEDWGDKRLKKKFNKGNVFFKIELKKMGRCLSEFEDVDEVILNVDIISQSEDMKDLRTKKNGEITKRKIVKKLNDEIKKNALYNSDELKINNKVINLIKVEKKDECDKKKSSHTVLWRTMKEDEVEKKKKIYNICQIVNEKIYKLMTKVCQKKLIFENRFYLEKIKEEFFEEDDEINEVLDELKKIKDVNLDDVELKKYLNKLFNTSTEGNKKFSENKKIFSEKVLNYLEGKVELDIENIVEFLIGELKYYSLTKRIEKSPKGNDKNLERTYILLDRHEKLKEVKFRKNEIVKNLTIKLKEDKIKNMIKNILSGFKISKLVDNLNENIEKGKLDTELYEIYKKHYVECVKDVEFNNLCSEKKELYKIVYRYIKGRIEKILQNRNKIKSKELIVEEIFNEETLLNKIEIRVKQYLLEHILYLGKLKHHNIDEANTVRFVEEHANEELALELITLFSATNVELNRLLRVKIVDPNCLLKFKKKQEIYKKDHDFFGDSPDKGNIKIRDTNSVIKFELLKKLKFINLEATEINQEAIDFLKEAYNLRNRILHGKNEEIFEENKKNLSKSYKNINEVIEELRPSDNEICKSLNLDIVFEGKEEYINKINALKYKDSDQNLYFPSFSKLVPEIKRKIQERCINDEDVEKIILNGAIYVSKILYLKETMNKESGFIKKFEEKFKKKSEKKFEKKSEKPSIEKLYKEAQISVSKGNRKAINMFQKRIIDIYLEYIEENYKGITDFSDFKLSMEEIKEKIENRKNSENKVLIKSIKQEVNPTNDFEYIISIFALLNDNVFVNKIKNRFFKTKEWLKDDQYSNIIKILNEIISVDVLRTESLNISIDAEEIEDIVLTKNIENENITTEIKDEIFKKIRENFKKLLMDNEIFKEGLNKEDICKIKTMKDENIELSISKHGIEVKLKNYGSKAPNAKLRTNITKYYNKEIAKRIDQISILTFTKKSIVTISDEKFKNIYYQERKEHDENEKLFVYNKNILYLVTKHSFEKLYKIFLEEELNNLKSDDTKKLMDLDLRREKYLNVDNTLKEINEKVKGYSKEYKNRLIKNLKDKEAHFSKAVSGRFTNYPEFKEIYDEVSEYKKIRDIVNFNPLNKVYHYLIEINWKLAIQMARVERDLHYIVNGLNELGLITLSDRTGNNEKSSRPYPKYSNGNIDLEKCYYNFDNDNYKKFEEICGKFDINLSTKGELQKKDEKNIRNYISHFYISRKPFNNESIADSVNRISKLLSYRTRYNNSTYSSVFEVFKKDVELNYDFLKKKIELDEKTYDEIVQRKKISCLELESYLDYKPIIERLLFEDGKKEQILQKMEY